MILIILGAIIVCIFLWKEEHEPAVSILGAVLGGALGIAFGLVLLLVVLLFGGETYTEEYSLYALTDHAETVYPRETGIKDQTGKYVIEFNENDVYVTETTDAPKLIITKQSYYANVLFPFISIVMISDEIENYTFYIPHGTAPYEYAILDYAQADE